MLLRTVVLAGAILASGLAAQAETFVLVTHARGTEEFVQIIEKGARDAGDAVGVRIETYANPSGDLADMARTIEAVSARQPDGIIATLPDVDALGDALRSAVQSGIPLITINSGIDHYKEVGALTHVGQPEYDAGFGVGERAKAEGVTRPLCMNPDQANKAFFERCNGFFDALGVKGTEIETSYDLTQVRARTTAALETDQTIDGVLATAPTLCTTAAGAIRDIGDDIHLSCFDLSPDITNLIKTGEVQFTVDQQMRLQGYLPVVLLSLYNTGNGLMPTTPTDTGPAFVDKSNVEGVEALAGVDR